MNLLIWTNLQSSAPALMITTWGFWMKAAGGSLPSRRGSPGRKLQIYEGKFLNKYILSPWLSPLWLRKNLPHVINVTTRSHVNQLYTSLSLVGTLTTLPWDPPTLHHRHWYYGAAVQEEKMRTTWMRWRTHRGLVEDAEDRVRWRKRPLRAALQTTALSDDLSTSQCPLITCSTKCCTTSLTPLLVLLKAPDWFVLLMDGIRKKKALQLHSLTAHVILRQKGAQRQTKGPFFLLCSHHPSTLNTTESHNRHTTNDLNKTKNYKVAQKWQQMTNILRVDVMQTPNRSIWCDYSMNTGKPPLHCASPLSYVAPWFLLRAQNFENH